MNSAERYEVFKFVSIFPVAVEIFDWYYVMNIQSSTRFCLANLAKLFVSFSSLSCLRQPIWSILAWIFTTSPVWVSWSSLRKRCPFSTTGDGAKPTVPFTRIINFVDCVGLSARLANKVKVIFWSSCFRSWLSCSIGSTTSLRAKFLIAIRPALKDFMALLASVHSVFCRVAWRVSLTVLWCFRITAHGTESTSAVFRLSKLFTASLTPTESSFSTSYFPALVAAINAMPVGFVKENLPTQSASFGLMIGRTLMPALSRAVSFIWVSEVNKLFTALRTNLRGQLNASSRWLQVTKAGHTAWRVCIRRQVANLPKPTDIIADFARLVNGIPSSVWRIKALQGPLAYKALVEWS